MVKVHVLHGEESFLVDEKERALVSQVKNSSVVRLDMRQTSIDMMINEAEQTDIFALEAEKILILKDCFFLGSEKGLSENDVKSLLTFIKSSSSATLIFRTEKLDKRKKIGKELLKVGEEYEGKSIRFPQKWIIERGKHYNLLLNTNASEKMFQELGNNLYVLDSELKKIALIYPRAKINESMLQGILSRTLESDVFELINRIVNRKASALEILRDILLTGSDSIKILLLVARQLRIMRSIKVAEYEGLEPKKVLDIHPYAFQKAKEQSDCYELAELNAKIQEVADLDLKMKRGQVDKEIALETMILSWL